MAGWLALAACQGQRLKFKFNIDNSHLWKGVLETEVVRLFVRKLIGRIIVQQDKRPVKSTNQVRTHLKSANQIKGALK